LLLHTDHEPAHPDEWEQWITATRKALSHHALTLDTAVLKPGQRTRSPYFVSSTPTAKTVNQTALAARPALLQP
jgi:hypothetical protein